MLKSADAVHPPSPPVASDSGGARTRDDTSGGSGKTHSSQHSSPFPSYAGGALVRGLTEDRLECAGLHADSCNICLFASCSAGDGHSRAEALNRTSSPKSVHPPSLLPSYAVGALVRGVTESRSGMECAGLGLLLVLVETMSFDVAVEVRCVDCGDCILFVVVRSVCAT